MPGNLFAIQEKERVMLNLLRRHGRLPLTDQRILDIGCAAGKTLLTLLRYGARPENLFGVDLLEDQIEEARRIAPHVCFGISDARTLPFDADSFDLLLAFGLFSSVQGRENRQLVADEMTRVLRPTGAALVYDFSIASRVNPDTEPIRLKEIRELFPNCHMDARRLTLAPPLARSLASRAWLACELLVKVPGLTTHRIALITPEAASQVPSENRD
jgi:ubiquinone/menaquinone biosynthesis C-methylase UbiE